MDDNGQFQSIIVTLSEEEIIRSYWPYWSEQMKNKGYTNLCKEDCLDDWVTVNWAWESTNED